MAVRIRLQRLGKIRNPQYRIVVADSRTKRDGRTIENLGIYHPKEDPSRIEVDSERVQHWLSVGAQPSDPVQAILRKTGDWQKFRGLPAPANPLRAAPPKVDRHAVYEAEAKAAAGLADQPGKGEAAPAKKAAKKTAKKAAAKAEAKVDDKADKAAAKVDDKADTAEAAGEKADKAAADKAGEQAEAKADKAGEQAEAKADKAAATADDQAGADAEASA